MKLPAWLASLRDVVYSGTSTLREPQYWLTDALGGPQSSTGAVVNERSALSAVAVGACVRVLADSVAQLPLKVQRVTDGVHEDDRRHPLWSILHDLFNPEMTAYEGKHIMQGHLALQGNAYAEIERDGFGRIVGLWPLNPSKTQVIRNEQLQKVWLYELPNGDKVKFTWADPSRQPAPILHLRGLGDSLVGYSPLTLLRNSIGLTIAAEEYGARLFSNSAQPRGVLQTTKTLSKPAADQLKSSWEAAHRGLDKAHRVAVLEDGVTWQQVGMNADDAQFIEARKFQTTEIARAFRVPPHMIGDLERSTFSNIEHQGISFVVHTLMPWLVCWEQAIGRDLLSAKSFATHQVRFTVQGLQRGDMASRYAAYAIGRNWGWLSADDVRALEDMNPLPDGQGSKYLSPLNMQDAALPPQPPPMPDPPMSDPDADPDDETIN